MVDVRKQCVGHPRKHNGGWRNEQLTCAILHCGWRNEQFTCAILIHISYTTITMPLKPCEHAPL